jgi:UDP-2,3-diacylglucosamine pyrophosphatase LpxH
MNNLKLAVISDMHVGSAARSKDLCPEPPSTERKALKIYKAKTDNKYRQTFVRFLEQQNITADYLILPGDVTHRAQPQEVEIASEFILQAADALKVPHDKIVFVPGNHDVDWSAFDPADTTGLRWEQRYAWVGHNRYHFRKIIDAGDGDVLSPPHFTVWNHPDLLAVGYNSCSHDAPVHTDAAHHGLADPDHLNALRAQLETIGKPDGKVRLFLVHHHPIDFTSPVPRMPEFSLMTNAEALLNLLHEYHFDILIHGHRHHPRFETHSTHTYPHLPILCSGSFSMELDTEWAGTVDNQFHLVTITGRFGRDNHITGTLTSWTNKRAKGWIPSEESTSGIHHIIPFGSYLMPAELDARLEPYITNWLQTHDHILWKQVIREFPDLEHLPLNSALAAFHRISNRLGRQSMYQTLKDLMLY